MTTANSNGGGPDVADSLVARYVEIDIALENPAARLGERVETALLTHGEPLRWAITAVSQGLAHVEAVVTYSATDQPADLSKP